MKTVLKETESMLKSPTVNIHNFGGGKLNILGHITVDTSRGNYKYRATILVQKGF